MDDLITWLGFLAEAEDDRQVLALANEFLGRLTSRQVMLLPAACRPRQLASAVDLNSYALDLVRCSSTDAEVVALVQRMMAFLYESAQRLAHLAARERMQSQESGEQAA